MIRRFHSVLVFALVLGFQFLFSDEVRAQGLAMGGSAGMDFPLAHTDTAEAGVAAEGFYRIDVYEVRFHYSYHNLHTYSVVLGVKKFLTESLVRPYIEGAFGPMIVNTPGRGLAYGFKPEVSLGADLGINSWLSTGIVARYSGWAYFGDTNSGKAEFNHSLGILANLIIWF